jgi:O-antigen ligase
MGKKSRKKREKQLNREKNGFAGKHKAPITGIPAATEKIYLAVIRWGIYFLLFVPLIVHNNFFYPFVGPKGLYIMGLIQVIFFVWLFLAIRFPKYRPKKNPLFFALIVFLIILTLATIFGQDPARSFWSKFERTTGLLMWYHLFALFLAVFTAVKQKKDWLKIFAVSVFAACIVCFLFLMNPEGDGKLGTAKLGSTLGNSSFLATYLLFNLYFAIYLLVSVWKKTLSRLASALWRFALAGVIFSIVLMFLVLYRCGGEGAFLSFLGGLGLLFLFWWAFQVKKERLRKLGKIALASGFLMFLLAVILLHIPGSIIQDKLIEVRSMARPLVWQSAWQGFLERPILGWGPQNFAMPFNKHFDSCFYLPVCGGESRFDQAHNVIFDNLVDGGILGFLGYFSVLGSFLFVLWKAYYKRKLDFWIAAIFSALLIAYFTQNLFVFDMPTSYLMFFLVLGFVASVTAGKENLDNNIISTGAPQGIIAAVLIILFIFTFNNFVLKPRASGSGVIQVLVARDGEAKQEAYNKALHSSPMGIYQTRAHLAVDLSSRIQREEVPQWEAELLLSELKKSVKASPLDYYSYLILGTIYNDYGAAFQNTEAVLRSEEILKKAIEIAPRKQAGYWELAKNQAMLNNPEEAIRYAQKAVDLEPRYEYSHIFLLNILNIFDKTELLEQKTREAIQVLPGIAPKVEQFLPHEVKIEDGGTIDLSL